MDNTVGPLIFLHGWLGDEADFEPLRPILPGMSTVPLPGHGGLDLGDESTTGDALAHLAGRINKSAGDRSFTLAGYSMGGRLAAWLVDAGLVRPDKLVLIAASPGSADERERRERLARDRDLAKRLRDEDFAAFLDQWYRQSLFGDLRHRPEFGALIERRLRHDRQQLARALELFSVGRQPYLGGFRLAPDILYLAGNRDAKYAQVATETATGAVIIEDAGHAVHLEKPEAVGELILEFWRKK